MELSVLALRLSWNRNVEALSFSAVAPSDAFFLSFSEKWSISDKKVAKSLAVSRILLTFAVRVGADGKERLR